MIVAVVLFLSATLLAAPTFGHGDVHERDLRIQGRVGNGEAEQLRYAEALSQMDPSLRAHEEIESRRRLKYRTESLERNVKGIHHGMSSAHGNDQFERRTDGSSSRKHRETLLHIARFGPGVRSERSGVRPLQDGEEQDSDPNPSWTETDTVLLILVCVLAVGVCISFACGWYIHKRKVAKQRGRLNNWQNEMELANRNRGRVKSDVPAPSRRVEPDK